MIKRVFYTLFLASTLCFAGCNDWLDVPNKQEVIDYEMFANEQGFMDALSGSYYLMSRDELYGDMLTLTFLDLMAHRYKTDAYLTNLSQDLDLATYFESEYAKPVVEAFWNKGYNVIANLNSLLEQVEDYKDVFKYDNYDMIRGEAFGLRAFMHFDLMRLYGRTYSESANVKVMPYVTELQGAVIPPLLTEDEIIELALADLDVAEALLEGDDMHSSSVENTWLNDRYGHFNLYAVYATKARIYHWMGDTENALLYAKKVIDSGQFTFFTPPASAYSAWDAAFSTESVFALYKDDMQELYQRRVTTVAQDLLFNEPSETEAVYEITSGGSTDYRLNWVLGYYADQNGGTYAQYRNRRYDTYLNPNAIITLIRLTEMYYIAAECVGNTEEGRGYLNTVRANRGLSQLPDIMTDEDFENELFKEYQKEFYMEGQLFYYYKRKGITVILDHDNATYVDISGMGWVLPMPEAEANLRESYEEIMNRNEGE